MELGNWLPEYDPNAMQAAMRRLPMAAARPPAGPITPGPAMPSPVPAPAAPPAGLPPAGLQPSVLPGAGLSNAARVAGGLQPPAGAPPVPPPPQATPPPPSDDAALLRQDEEGIKGARATLQREGEKTAAIQGQMPTPPTNQTPTWRKVLGGIMQAVPFAPAQILGRYTAGQPQYEQRVAGYERQRQSALDQLAAEREIGVPLAQDQARLAEADWDRQFKLIQEQRRMKEAANETGEKIYQRTGADGQIHYYTATKGGTEREVPEPREQAEDRRKREEDASTPAPGARPEPDPENKGQYRVQTKAGGYIPWYPRTPEEGAMLGDKRATALFMQEHPGREKAATNGAWTGPEAKEIAQKQRPVMMEISSILQEQRQLQYGTDDLSKQDYANNAKKLAELHQQLNDIEDAVEAKRTGKPSKSVTGNAKGNGPAEVPFGLNMGGPTQQPGGPSGFNIGAPPTTGGKFTLPSWVPAERRTPPGPDAYLRVNGKAIAYSADGREWGPVPAKKPVASTASAGAQ